MNGCVVRCLVILDFHMHQAISGGYGIGSASSCGNSRSAAAPNSTQSKRCAPACSAGVDSDAKRNILGSLISKPECLGSRRTERISRPLGPDLGFGNLDVRASSKGPGVALRVRTQEVANILLGEAVDFIETDSAAITKRLHSG